MNILVIKQTSLGDVLHATPHIRAIKNKYPEAHLTVLTAKNSAEIYQHNPHIDRLVLFDYARFKAIGLASPIKLPALFKQTLAKLNDREYDLAFDLQGLARSVIFLYRVQAKQKFVKGRWLGLQGFRNKQLHAIDEMSKVLNIANIPVEASTMQFFAADDAPANLQNNLAKHRLAALLSAKQNFIIISPFTRWESKNWPLENFVNAAQALSQTQTVLITGTQADRNKIALALGGQQDNIINLAGELSLSELALLMQNAALVISGDSFPMHLSAAMGAPLLALFGPTDERKTGPRSKPSAVMRPKDCQRCDKSNCQKACLKQITVDEVSQQALRLL